MLDPHIPAPRWRDLTTEEQAWVDRTLASLSAEARIGQLFNFAVNDDPEAIEAVRGLGAGAFHRFPGADLAHARDVTRALLEQSPIPPLLSGDIEGGEVSFGFATALPNQLGIAAADDPALTYQLARIAAEEARAIGCDWSFAPVVDINAAFRSTVVGTRSYGSDVPRILAHASAHIAATQDAGLAACAKHWPGEGFDDRDQHLLTTVNPLDMDAWRASFGHIYHELIERGVMTIMAGHIALPAYAAVRDRSAYAPASVSAALNIDLLRGELGFRGLLVSDASVMGGLTSWMDRAEAVPAIIENGCDMLLFSRDPVGDVALMRDGLRTGRLSEARVEEAVSRVLSLKALLGLHRSEIDDRLPDVSLRSAGSRASADEAAAKSLTLVKDVPGLLPLSPVRHRRIVIAAEREQAVFIDGAPPRSFAPLHDALVRAGFDVRAYDPDQPPTGEDSDLLLYVVGREATPVIASAQIDWASLHGSAKKAMRRHLGIPTLMVAFGHPYLLYDAPWIGTFVNAYSAIEPVQRALVAALTGEAGFPGRSPVDPLCGRPELAF
ncbi:glycoside hydrolase family 3 protein [Sphingomonas glacialis]|uniref:beta-N-acetylhexosaminidase n=1 Tax=Sphingomonas glacialis TaxID=658225 RepID=A0A502FZV0_9SPHN|nr:glycoside hydrolase family 3 N-terminal domain-containing protein [Sphingomonas glacialis]TPG54576.1 glycoside hydrolase family 3 protein [Sphingomonas glacialis]